MSYSRWFNSRWYTFWCVHPRDQKETRASALFSVMDSNASLEERGERQFNAAEIRKNVAACVGQYAGTVQELEELKGYMLEFVADVDARYPSQPHQTERKNDAIRNAGNLWKPGRVRAVRKAVHR